MGYTHYWYTPDDLDLPAYRRGVLDAARILQASPVPLADFKGDGEKPEINERRIAFNGRDDDAHETCDFDLDPLNSPDAWRAGDGRLFNFCKTAHKPYDVVVVAVLATIHARCPGLDVSSDGGPDDWTKGVDLARRILDDPTIEIPAGVAS